MGNLSEEELIHLVEQKPEVQAKKMMSVLIKWAKKRQFVPDSSEEPSEKKQKLEEVKIKEENEDSEKDSEKKETETEKEGEIEKAENVALTEMLKSFVDKQPAKATTERIGRRPPMAPASRRGPGRPAAERGPASGPDLAVVGEKKSKNPGSGGVIVNKTDDELALL